MAAAQTNVSSDFSAEIVGNAFVSQFYNLLHKSPEDVYRFYNDSSTMSRPGPDGTLATVTAMEGIKDLMLSLDCKDYKAEILTADSQASYMNGVIVLVTGCLTGKDNVRRNFTESFFLAPQDKGYFVLNDSFRFIEQGGTPEVNQGEDVDVDKIAPVPPSIPVEQTTEATVVAVNHAPAAEAVAETISLSIDEPKPTVTEETVLQASVDSGRKVQPLAETLSNGDVDVPKMSYASILRYQNGSPTQTVVRKPATAVKAATVKTAQKNAVPASASQQARPAPVSVAVSESSTPNGSNGNVAIQAKDKDHSIYIGDLPFDATAAQVEQEFKKFGPIKCNGIQVRSKLGFCFGFVEFEDATGKQKAVDAAYITIGGKEAFIQEKKTGTRVHNGKTIYPTGRNGYRNDDVKGRGNYSNVGRGSSRNDYGKRSGEVSSRGFRNVEGEVYQNGGGRGAQGDAPK